jgi:hypothetical protein
VCVDMMCEPGWGGGGMGGKTMSIGSLGGSNRLVGNGGGMMDVGGT